MVYVRSDQIRTTHRPALGRDNGLSVEQESIPQPLYRCATVVIYRMVTQTSRPANLRQLRILIRGEWSATYQQQPKRSTTGTPQAR